MMLVIILVSRLDIIDLVNKIKADTNLIKLFHFVSLSKFFLNM